MNKSANIRSFIIESIDGKINHDQGYLSNGYNYEVQIVKDYKLTKNPIAIMCLLFFGT